MLNVLVRPCLWNKVLRRSDLTKWMKDQCSTYNLGLKQTSDIWYLIDYVTLCVNVLFHEPKETQ